MLELKDVNVDKIDLKKNHSGIDYIIYDDNDKIPSLRISIKNLYAPFRPQKFNNKRYCFGRLKLNKEDANKILEIEKKIRDIISHHLGHQKFNQKFTSLLRDRGNEKYMSIELGHNGICFYDTFFLIMLKLLVKRGLIIILVL